MIFGCLKLSSSHIFESSCAHTIPYPFKNIFLKKFSRWAPKIHFFKRYLLSVTHVFQVICPGLLLTATYLSPHTHTETTPLEALLRKLPSSERKMGENSRMQF